MGFFESLQIKQKEEGPRTPIVSSFYTAPQAIMAEKPYYALVQAYKSWIYTCIDKISKAVAMIPLNLFVYRSQSTGRKVIDLQWRAEYKSMKTEGERKYFLKEMGLKKEQVFDHPFLSLIHRPNSLMTRFMLWYETMVRLELGGLCGWLQVKNSLKVPQEIWPLPLTQFAMLRPKITPSLRLQYWDYQDGDVKQRFEPDEVLLYKYPHPASPFQAMSPLMAQTYPYDIDLFMMQQQRGLFKNMAVPGISLTTDQTLTKEQRRELEEQFAEYEGAMQAGKTTIFHSGLKPDKLTMTGRDALLNEVQQFVREKLITAYDLSPSKVGLHEKDNRATAEVMDETFIKECLKPKCMLIEEVIETFMLPQYDDGITCDFELPSYPDREFLLRERETNLRTGYHTINKELEINGESPVPWGDKPWLPFGLMQPGGGAPAKPEGEKSVKSLKLMGRSFWTDERKGIYWKLFTKRVDNYQHLIETPMKKYFSALKEDVINRLHKDGNKVLAYFSGWSRQKVRQALKDHKGIREINIDKSEESKKLVRMVEPVVKGIMQEVGQHRMKDILETMKISTNFNADDEGPRKWLGSRMKQFSKQVSGTTFDEIERILKEGFAAESPVTEIAETLRQKFDSWEEYRAANIARTETIASLNKADIEGVRQTGLEDELLKHWLSSRDEHVRPTHQKADQEYADGIPMGELFKVGDDEMDAPGEGTDPAEVCQ